MLVFFETDVRLPTIVLSKVQPVVSLKTDWAFGLHTYLVKVAIKSNLCRMHFVRIVLLYVEIFVKCKLEVLSLSKCIFDQADFHTDLS